MCAVRGPAWIRLDDGGAKLSEQAPAGPHDAQPSFTTTAQHTCQDLSSAVDDRRVRLAATLLPTTIRLRRADGLLNRMKS